MSVSLEEELRWCSDGALTVLTLRGSRSGSCLWEDRCWEPKCVMTGWKRTSGKPPFFTDKQQHCRSGLFFPSFWKWQGICLRTLSRSRSSSKFEHRDDSLMGSAGRSYVHSSALQAQHPSPWWTACLPLSNSPGLPFSVLLAPAVIPSWDFRMPGAIKACFLWCLAL